MKAKKCNKLVRWKHTFANDLTASSTINVSNSCVASAILVEKIDKHCPNIVTSN